MQKIKQLNKCLLCWYRNVIMLKYTKRSRTRTWNWCGSGSSRLWFGLLMIQTLRRLAEGPNSIWFLFSFSFFSFIRIRHPFSRIIKSIWYQWLVTHVYKHYPSFQMVPMEGIEAVIAQCDLTFFPLAENRHMDCRCCIKIQICWMN